MRQLRVIVRTALAQLLGRKRQTVLVTAGVTIGAMVMIITFALTNGIIETIREKIVNVSPMITIKGERIPGKERILVDESPTRGVDMVSRIIPDEKKEVTPYPEVLAELNGIARVDAFSPFVQTSGVLRKGKSLRQVSLRGIDPVREGAVVNLDRNIVQGSLGELGFTPDGILLGDGLARKLTARYHEVIRLTTESGTVLSMTVVGIFSSGFSAADDNTGYINLARAQAISGRSRNAVSGIGVHSASMDRLPELARQIERATGYRAETWDEANANLLTVFQRNNNITLLLVVFVFIVSGFGIANTLVTTVLQKQRDIAVMKSIGFSVRSIEGIFLIQGAVIGIAGTLTGCIGGYALTEIIGLLPVSYGASAVVRGSSIAVVQTLSSYVITVCFSLAVSVGASVAPARRAARLQPVQILRA